MRNLNKSRNLELSMSTKSSKWGRNPPEEHFVFNQMLRLRAKSSRFTFFRFTSSLLHTPSVPTTSHPLFTDRPTVEHSKTNPSKLFIFMRWLIQLSRTIRDLTLEDSHVCVVCWMISWYLANDLHELTLFQSNCNVSHQTHAWWSLDHSQKT